jgi:hypothetical protein
MPADFGEISGYHRRLALRCQARAQAARDRGNLAEAEYQFSLASRYIQAAQEQKIAMRQEPGRSTANQSPRCWSPPPPSPPFAVRCLMTVLRGVKRVVAAMCRFMPKRSAGPGGLSLR